MYYSMLNESIDIQSHPSYQKDLHLYHSSDKKHEDGIVQFRFREKPRDTLKVIHEIVNEVSNERFTLPIRNLFFTYKDASKTESYGDNTYRIYPLGDNYKLFYHPSISDFTDHATDFLYKRDFIYEYANPIFDNDYLEILLSVVYYRSIRIAKDVDDVKRIMTERFKREDYYDKLKPYIDEIYNLYINEIYNFAKNYINEIIVTDNTDDISYQEIMVYSPDGFYVAQSSS